MTILNVVLVGSLILSDSLLVYILYKLRKTVTPDKTQETELIAPKMKEESYSVSKSAQAIVNHAFATASATLSAPNQAFWDSKNRVLVRSMTSSRKV